MSIKNDFFVILDAHTIEPVPPVAPAPAESVETNPKDDDDDKSP